MSKHQTWTEPADCPRCGGPSVYVRYSDHPEWPRHPQNCCACVETIVQRQAEFRGLFKSRFPDFSSRLRHALYRHYAHQARGFDMLLSAGDDELLAVRDLGQKMLAELRAAWPHPAPIVSTSGDWVEHAAMVALTGGA